jgi:hypothetical protein
MAAVHVDGGQHDPTTDAAITARWPRMNITRLKHYEHNKLSRLYELYADML